MMNKHDKRKFFRSAEINFFNSLRFTKSKADAVKIADYFMKMIRQELGTVSRTYFMCEDKNSASFGLLLPKEVSTDTDKTIKRTLDMETISYQWNTDRLMEQYHRSRYEEGVTLPMYHYYRELGVLEVINGTHSAAEAIINGETIVVEADDISLESLLRECETDGAIWVNNGSETPVHNPKVALLWSLARYKLMAAEDSWRKFSFCSEELRARGNKELVEYQKKKRCCDVCSKSDIEMWKDNRVHKTAKQRMILRVIDALQDKLTK